ncbi:MAG: HAMP domain-containing sensor histidine kinase [Prolixibacteraceae bacterium]
MNIKTRLSVEFSLLVFGILIFFSVLVYYFSYSSQRAKFRESLMQMAENTAILLINVEEVDSTLLKIIHQTTRSFEQEEIAITDEENTIIYSNKLLDLSPEILRGNTKLPNPYYFSIGEKDGVIYEHKTDSQLHRVFVLAYDQYRHENLSDLRNILLWSILFSVWLSVTASYFFSKRAIKPISEIIAKVKEINSSKLNSRLYEGNRKDEIEQLAITFNEMLSDLELVFKSQDEFVSNASHELRTPLAIMIAESDYILSRLRNPEEYARHISGLTDDLRKLNQLINSLLELAHLNRDNSIHQSVIRVDELIFNSIQDIKTKYPGRKILPKIEYSENEQDLFITGNAGLLEIAFKNLIDNACKFSNDDVHIAVSFTDEQVIVAFSDRGIGIPDSEIKRIFKAFNRGTNAKFIGGFGIGLSLVAKIVELHHAEFNVSSVENKGTSTELKFKKATS